MAAEIFKNGDHRIQLVVVLRNNVEFRSCEGDIRISTRMLATTKGRARIISTEGSAGKSEASCSHKFGGRLLPDSPLNLWRGKIANAEVSHRVTKNSRRLFQTQPSENIENKTPTGRMRLHDPGYSAPKFMIL